MGIQKRCFASLNMTMNIFACAIFCHCERAQRASVAINRQGILMILALYTVDCFAHARNDKNSVCKIFHCHVALAKHCIIASESVSSVTIETNQRSAPSGAQKPRV